MLPFFSVEHADGGLTATALFLCHPFTLAVCEQRVPPVRVCTGQLRFSLLLTQLISAVPPPTQVKVP